MKIQIWSDFSCPFCYIGKHHLSAALATFSGRESVETIFRSFELDPNASPQSDTNIYTHLAEKYDMSIYQVEEMTGLIVEQAKQAGLDFNFDSLIPTNTFDAHRLLHFASERGVSEPMSEVLFKAFFTDSANIGDRQTLIKLAADVGLEPQLVRDVLHSDSYADRVRADEYFAKQIKITSVPFFVFDNKYAVSGAQPVSAFTEVLDKVQEEARRLSHLENSKLHHGGPYGID
ncbi:DsbA family oxidoreductase [Budvicia diplopodorum]|uniref:DsbA family oxidoreductase n=1 Tax=Budvicia diplopodorum TaxID=1119056 RepID=UPI001358203E|nr:DsbA family oxidoreductase [Budvicia diplopodorum]